MKPGVIRPAASLRGAISLSGDKSIACRAVIISAITKGITLIRNFPANQDCQAAADVLRQLGVRIIKKGPGRLIVRGSGLKGLKAARKPVFTGESGTTLRLMLGVLSGQDFKATLTAGKSLSRRPMLRVTAPLRLMGAKITAIRNTQYAIPEEYPPLTIRGGNLKPITYRMPVASAQVKSAILFAGLYARGKTTVIEPLKTRDHTERMLNLFGAGIKVYQNKIVIEGGRELTSPKDFYIPADISSAAFFIVASLILPGSRILIKNVSLNPTRMGAIRVLKRMGSDIRFSVVSRTVPAGRQEPSDYEPMGDIIAKSSTLRGVIVKREEVPSLIDELPVLMVAACRAKGKTIFEGVQELRVKETDRISSMSRNLIKMGAKIRVVRSGKSENIIVEGSQLSGAKVNSFTDHRTAMSLAVAGLTAKGNTRIDDISCVNKSFPEFLQLLRRVSR